MKQSDFNDLLSAINSNVRLMVRLSLMFAYEHNEQFKQWVEEKKKEVKKDDFNKF